MQATDNILVLGWIERYVDILSDKEAAFIGSVDMPVWAGEMELGLYQAWGLRKLAELSDNNMDIMPLSTGWQVRVTWDCEAHIVRQRFTHKYLAVALLTALEAVLKPKVAFLIKDKTHYA